MRTLMRIMRRREAEEDPELSYYQRVNRLLSAHAVRAEALPTTTRSGVFQPVVRAVDRGPQTGRSPGFGQCPHRVRSIP